MTKKELAPNHERIWLQPRCCTEDRCWSAEPQPCDDCDEPPVEYIRADLVAAIKTDEEYAREKE